MFPWLNSTKYAEAGDPDAGGGLAVADPPEGEDKKKPDPTETRLKAMETEIANLRKKNEELAESERAWSERALRASRPQESDDEPEPSDPASPEIAESAEQFLDDVAKDGMKALFKRGIPTMADVQRLVQESIARTVGEVRSEGTFDSIIAREFPELAADTQRVADGKKPESEIYTLARDIYREAVKLDPQLKGSKSALIIAARQAKAQLTAEGKMKADDKADKQEQRRQRIDAQRPPRGADDGDDEATVLTPAQKQMAKDLGISEDKFLKHQEALRGKRGK